MSLCDGSFNPAATYVEAANTDILVNNKPYRVTQDGEQNATGIAKRTSRDDFQCWDSNRIQQYVNGHVVIQYSANNRYSESIQVQAEAGVHVLFTHSDPESVLIDAAAAAANPQGTPTFACLWTELTLAGTPVPTGLLNGSVTGVRFYGTGQVVVTKL